MTISIIVPALNDTELISATLGCLPEPGNNFEVIVVDGEIEERTLKVADGRARVVAVPGVSGGALLNAGAAAATGDIFLFLWPGSCLPVDALPALERNLELLPQTIGGGFHLNFNENTLFTRWVTKFLRMWRYKGHYYGPGGIFIRRKVFLDLGGFRSYNLLEDYDLARRMENYGPTLYLPETIIVSTRRFQGKQLKAAFLWLIIHSLFTLGVHPNRLARWCRL
jgi:GT2 family glycosyltransferase